MAKFPPSTVAFARLFAGRDDARGNGKKGVTRRAVTTMDYQAHLDGSGEALGIFPVRDDLTVDWACIDLDLPDRTLATALQSLIPGRAWLEESPSGNFHIWVFFDRPCPAWVARAVLRGVTGAAGCPKAEVFPKQDQLRPGMVGNYIQLPYFGDRTDVEGWQLEDFLNLAGQPRNRAAVDDWTERAERVAAAPGAREGREQGSAPTLHRCAKRIIQNRESNPVSEGHRNVVLFNLSKMLLDYKEFTEDEAREFLGLVNDASPDPLPERDLDRLFTNALAGGFTSYGCDDPIMEPFIDPSCPIYKGET